DDGALGVLALAVAGAGPLALALPVDRVHAVHSDVEDLLHGDLDLGLVRVRADQERVLVLVQQPVALLRDHRGQQDVPRVRAHATSSLPLVGSVRVAAGLIASFARSFTRRPPRPRRWPPPAPPRRPPWTTRTRGPPRWRRRPTEPRRRPGRRPR